MSEDVSEFIGGLSVFQIIQLYLVNDLGDNESALYGVLYSVMNDIKSTVNIKEVQDTLAGRKLKSDDLLELVLKKLEDLKGQIQSKHSRSTPVYRLTTASLKPKPSFTKKPSKKEEEAQTFEIFNLQKRKRQASPKRLVSPKDFFEGRIPKTAQEEPKTIEQSIEDDLGEGEVILEPWSTEDTSTPVAKKARTDEVPARVSSRKSTNPRKLLPSMMKKKRREKATPTQPLRRSPRKTPQKKIIVIEESPQTKPIGLISSERRAKSEMERSRRKLELGDDDGNSVLEIGREILDSEDTDPEDDVPLASLQPVLANSTQIKSEEAKTPEPSKKLKKKREEFFTISSVIKPPSAVNQRSRRSPVKSPQNINERYRATSLAFSQMLNPDYVPPAADDVLDSPKKAKSIEPKNLSRTLSENDFDETGSQPPELEDMDDTLAEPLPESESDDLADDEEAQMLLRAAKQIEPPSTPKKAARSTPFTTPRKTPRKTPVKTPRKTPVKLRTPRKTPTRSSPRKTPRKTPLKTPPVVSDPDVNKNEKKKKKKRKKKLNLRALAAAKTKTTRSESVSSDELIVKDTSTDEGINVSMDEVKVQPEKVKVQVPKTTPEVTEIKTRKKSVRIIEQEKKKVTPTQQPVRTRGRPRK